MRSRTSVFAVAAAVAALLGAGAGGVITDASARADAIAGTMTVTPTSGNAVTDEYFLDSIAASVGATAPYTALGGTFVYQDGVELGSISNARNASMAVTAGASGLNGNPAFMDRSIIPTNNYVSNKKLSEISTPLRSGPFELRFYYFASATSPDRTTDPYLSLDLTFDAATDEWQVVLAKLKSSVSLSAASSGSSVTLSATVKDAESGSPALNATGVIQFFEGTTQVGTVDVAAAVGAVTVVGVPNGDHTYTAKFTPSNSGDRGSTSDPATVNVGFVLPPPAISAAPPGPGGVSLSVSFSDLAMEEAQPGDDSATVRVSVVDGRPASSLPWTLTGQVNAGSAAGGTFGWTAGVSGSGIALPPSSPATGGIAELAAGKPGDTTPTNVTARVEPAARPGSQAAERPRTITITLF